MPEFLITYWVKDRPDLPEVQCLVEAEYREDARQTASRLCHAAERLFPKDQLVRTGVCTLEQHLEELREQARELEEQLDDLPEDPDV